MPGLDTLPHPIGLDKNEVTTKSTVYVVDEGEDYGPCLYWVRTQSGQDIAHVSSTDRESRIKGLLHVFQVDVQQRMVTDCATPT